MSHPVWVRGLKHLFKTRQFYGRMSHPVWVRGLKHNVDFMLDSANMSHPVWVRGLKLKQLRVGVHRHLVAPRVGAWIETGILLHTYSA